MTEAGRWQPFASSASRRDWASSRRSRLSGRLVSVFQRTTASGSYPSRVRPRRVVTALVVGGVLLLVVLVGLYLVGKEECPPPAWAFWRFTEGPDGAENFACVAG